LSGNSIRTKLRLKEAGERLYYSPVSERFYYLDKRKHISDPFATLTEAAAALEKYIAYREGKDANTAPDHD
jgi:hypothetical protein